MDPYRTKVGVLKIERRSRFDRDLVGVFALVWLVAIVRVAFGLYRGQTFGAELTLATLAVLLIPLLLRR